MSALPTEIVDLTAEALNTEAHSLADDLAEKLSTSLAEADLDTVTGRLHDLVDAGFDAATLAADGLDEAEAEALLEEAADHAVAGLHAGVDIVDMYLTLPYGLDALFGPLAHSIISFVETAIEPNPERLNRRAKALDDKAEKLDGKEVKWDARSAEALAEGKAGRARRFANRADNKADKAKRKRGKADRKEARATALG